MRPHSRPPRHNRLLLDMSGINVLKTARMEASAAAKVARAEGGAAMAAARVKAKAAVKAARSKAKQARRASQRYSLRKASVCKSAGPGTVATPPP